MPSAALGARAPRASADAHSPGRPPRGRRRSPTPCARRAHTATPLRRAPLRWGTAQTPAPNEWRAPPWWDLSLPYFQVHPGAGVVRPVVSAKPNSRFIHWMAPPAAPLLRLSTTDMTAMELPLVTALKFA